MGTGANSRAIVRYDATDLVRLSANTDLTVGSLAAAQGGMEASLFQLWIGRARRAANPDFVAVAGSVVAAVEGTDFELNKPDASPNNVTLRVDHGSVLTGVTRAGGNAEFVRTLDAVMSGRGALELTRGFQVTVSRGAPVPEPSRAPARLGLGVVSATGKVFVVTASGNKVEVLPGDTVLEGAKVVVGGGKAVFANGDTSAEGGDGAAFTCHAQAGETDVAVKLAMDAGAKGDVTLESGTGTAPPAAEPEALVAPPAATASNDLPPPPPDTVNQDLQTVSPSAPI